MEKKEISLWQWQKFGITLAAIIICAYYSWLRHHQLDPTAALYVGLPSILALIIALMPKSKSVVEASMQALTIFLLLSIILFREGYICVIMAAPIFYTITAIIAYSIDSIIRQHKKKQGTKIQSSAIIMLAALLSLEGTHKNFSYDRFQEIQTEKIIDYTPEQVQKTLAKNQDFSKPTPFLARIFPKPYKIKGHGLTIGDRREVYFRYKKHIFFNEHTGSSVYEIISSDDKQITYKIIKDDSYISHYLNWKYSQINWQAVENGKTKIIWKLGYERKLDPAWYFGPLQYFYTKLTAEVLIDNLATPNGT